MFELATRSKFRFDTVKGQVTSEDLWDMPLSSRNGFDLDNVAIGLSKAITDTSEVSFVKATNSASKSLKDKLEVVKYIIEVKLQEASANEQAMANASKKAFLQEIIQSKQIDELKGKSLEELQAELSSL